MGGNLLKNWGLDEKRLNRDDFNRVQREVIALVNGCWPTIGHKFSDGSYEGGLIDMIPSYGAKESFGDLDLIVGTRNNIEELATELEVLVGYKPHLNGEVLSFPYDGFQVDLIIVPITGRYDWKPVTMAREYFSYNDASNLVGIMAANMGLQFGHKGLFLKVSERMLGRDNDNIVANLQLSTDPREIRSYMRMNEEVWQRGFHTLEDIFSWISFSKWFSKDVYLLENTNHKHRLRNRKRPTYQAFQEWLKTTNPTDSYVFNEDPAYYFDDIIASFPHVSAELENVRNELVCNDVIRAKFNGGLVSTITNLKGQELGLFMKFLEERFRDRKDALYMSPAKVIDWIKYWYDVYTMQDTTVPFIVMNRLVYGYNNTFHARKFLGPAATLTCDAKHFVLD